MKQKEQKLGKDSSKKKKKYKQGDSIVSSTRIESRYWQIPQAIREFFLFFFSLWFTLWNDTLPAIRYVSRGKRYDTCPATKPVAIITNGLIGEGRSWRGNREPKNFAIIDKLLNEIALTSAVSSNLVANCDRWTFLCGTCSYALRFSGYAGFKNLSPKNWFKGEMREQVEKNWNEYPPHG